jgi:hypothetical protein
MGVGILLLVAYVVYALGDASPAPEDLKLWAIALLVYIGACIVAGIVIQILFHIALAVGISVKETAKGNECDDKNVERIIKSSMVEDERDKLIDLKSSRIGYTFAGFGFVAGLIALAIGVPTVIALHIMAGAFAVGSIVEGFMSVHLNERGVHNG